jgi:hypothetical protein
MFPSVHFSSPLSLLTASNFTCNYDIESRDSSSLSVAFLTGSELNRVLPLIRNKQNTGVKRISKAQGTGEEWKNARV